MPGSGNLLTSAELATLSALRTRFLDGTNSGGGYWRSDEELALYNATFGERIGWKWDAVLGELHGRGCRPVARHIVDWGCGSGIAGRRVLEFCNDVESLTLTDVSPLAMQFAAARARELAPKLDVKTASPNAELARGALLLVSHVVNELSDTARAQLIAAARLASEVIWVEAGTHADSRRLIGVREELSGDFQIIAPCTHHRSCGMLAAGNERHWCHNFGRVPSEASQSAMWAQFGRELGIDMRTLPYSFLVLSRAGHDTQPGLSRIIGRPREAKGRMDILACDESGVRDLMLQQRDAPELFKSLHKERAGAVQQWRCDGSRIVDVHPRAD